MTKLPLRSLCLLTTYALWLSGGGPALLLAQDDAQSANTPVENEEPAIANEPRSIDPASLVHPKLTQKAMIAFDDATLDEIKAWLEETTGMPVVIDRRKLKREGRSLYDEYTDRLQNAPIYFLLNRLDEKELGWYVKDEILYITTNRATAALLETKTYTVGDLLDTDYDGTGLIEVIYNATAGPWMEIDQKGGDAKLLGDVLFVNQTAQQHLRIRGLLAALRNHGRETYSFEPEQHQAILKKLEEPASIDFQNVPLFEVVEKLSAQTGLDIRLNEARLPNEGVNPRDTVSLSIEDRKLKTILNLLFGELALTTIVEDGVVLVTTEVAATERLKTVVYDVSDLCKNENENMGLMDAIYSQTSGPWMENENQGGDIVFPRHDTMVIRQTADVLAEARSLLNSYREAIKVSKPRQKKDDSNEIITHYYKLDAAIAEELHEDLWTLIPDGEVDQAKEIPENLGRVLVLASQPMLKQGIIGNAKVGHSTGDIALIPQSTMIITHYKKIHLQVEELIHRIENGDPPISSQDQHGSPTARGGQQGGYGGGGFFSVSPR